jgi:pilus assembly protein Flp/PilA
MRQKLKSFWNNEDGATAIEYGLICALIGLAIAASAALTGNAINAIFVKDADLISKAWPS